MFQCLLIFAFSWLWWILVVCPLFSWWCFCSFFMVHFIYLSLLRFLWLLLVADQYWASMDFSCCSTVTSSWGYSVIFVRSPWLGESWKATFFDQHFFNQGVGVLFISICIYLNRNALIILGKQKPCIKDNKWRWTHLYSVNQSNSSSIELLKNRCELLCELDQGHFFQRASSKLFQERRASPDKYRMVCK